MPTVTALALSLWLTGTASRPTSVSSSPTSFDQVARDVADRPAPAHGESSI